MSAVGMLRGVRAGLAPLAKTLLLQTGALTAFRRALPSRSLAILRYHAICGPEGYGYADPQICITAAAFERHVAYLARRYAILRLDDAVARIAAGDALPANALAITFDDGYADNLAAADPREVRRYRHLLHHRRLPRGRPALLAL